MDEFVRQRAVARVMIWKQGFCLLIIFITGTYDKIEHGIWLFFIFLKMSLLAFQNLKISNKAAFISKPELFETPNPYPNIHFQNLSTSKIQNLKSQNLKHQRLSPNIPQTPIYSHKQQYKPSTPTLAHRPPNLMLNYCLANPSARSSTCRALSPMFDPLRKSIRSESPILPFSSLTRQKTPGSGCLKG